MPLFYTATVTADVSTATTSSDWFPLNQFPDTFSVGFGVHVSGGTPTYRVEHTFEKPASARDTSVTVFVHSDVSAENADKDGNIAFPVAAVRLTLLSAATPPGEATIWLRQTGH